MTVIETPKLKAKEKTSMISREMNLHNPFSSGKPLEETKQHEPNHYFVQHDLVEEGRESLEMSAEDLFNKRVRPSNDIFRVFRPSDQPPEPAGKAGEEPGVGHEQAPQPIYAHYREFCLQGSRSMKAPSLLGKAVNSRNARSSLGTKLGA